MPVSWTLESKNTLISSADLTWESTLTSWNASWQIQRNMKASLTLKVFSSRHGIHHLSIFIMLQHSSSAVLQASNTPFWSLSTMGKASPKHLSSLIKCAGNCPRHGCLSVTTKTNTQTNQASCHSCLHSRIERFTGQILAQSESCSTACASPTCPWSPSAYSDRSPRCTFPAL